MRIKKMSFGKKMFMAALFLGSIILLLCSAVTAPEWVPFETPGVPQEAPPEMVVVSASESEVIVEIRVPGMNVYYEGDYQRLAIPTGEPFMADGKPEVPMLRLTLEVPLPPGNMAPKVEILEKDARMFDGYHLYPPGGYEPVDVFYPEVLVEAEGSVSADSILTLRVFPVQYNTETTALKGHSFIMARIYTDTGPGDPGDYSATFTFDEPKITELPDETEKVDMKGTWQDDTEVGAPILPHKTAFFFVEPELMAQEVMIKRSDPEYLPGYHYVQFGKPPIPYLYDGPLPPMEPNEKIYNTDEFYPPAPEVIKGKVQMLHGVKIVRVDFPAAQYNPVKGSIRYSPRVEVSVKTTQGDVLPLSPIVFSNTPFRVNSILSLVSNTNTFMAYVRKFPPWYPLKSYRYLVITTKAMAPTFKKLTDFRETIHGGAFTTHIETISHINTNFTGVDLAEKMRNYIIYSYKNYGTEYVVLGGDCDGVQANQVIPTRGCSVSGGYTDNYIPADLYFGCLDGNWNNDGDALWCESNDGSGGGDIDWLSEVYVGRIAADDKTEADNHIAKIIDYETPMNPDKTLLVGEKLDSTPTWGGDRMDWVYTFMGGMSKSTLYDRTATWAKSQLLTEINSNKYSWLNHLGHSNVTYNMKMSNSDVSSMKNKDFFFLYSQGCYSGSMDSRSTSGSYYASDCFGEEVTNSYKDRGAFGYIGNSRYGWYNPGSYVQGASNRLHKEFVEAVITDGYKRLGMANQKSKLDITKTSWVNRWIAFETNLFGDPASNLLPFRCTKFSAMSGKWDQAFGPTNLGDILCIRPGHTVTATKLLGGNPDKVKGIINLGTINKEQGKTIVLRASDFIYNGAYMLTPSGKNSNCGLAKYRADFYNHAKGAGDINLGASMVVNRGKVFSGKGGLDDTGGCLNDNSLGAWSLYIPGKYWGYFFGRFQSSNFGTWMKQRTNGETEFGYPTVGGDGGDVVVKSGLEYFINTGHIRGGRGGNAENIPVHGLGLGGLGGAVTVSVLIGSPMFGPSFNSGILEGGCGGLAEIAIAWEKGDIAWVTNAYPSRPGKGGNVTFNAGTGFGEILGCPGGKIRWDPVTLRADGTTRIDGGDTVEIFGGENWTMDLTGLEPGAIKAADSIILAVGPGGTINLRGLEDVVLVAGNRLEIFADEILLEDGMDLMQLAQAPEIDLHPGRIMYRVELSSQGSVSGEAGETVVVMVNVLNSGPTEDTYVFELDNPMEWPVASLPEKMTLKGLHNDTFSVEVTIPEDADGPNVLTFSAASLSDPETVALADVEVSVLPEDMVDTDGDGVPDDEDAFPNDPNEWLDSDGDGIGNNADPDDDNDGMPDIWEGDNGLDPYTDDADEDLDEDLWTNMDEYNNGTDPADASDPGTPPDRDEDGVPDVDDNCVDTYNPDQADIDGDGIGDACDMKGDLDNDGDVDRDDLAIIREHLNMSADVCPPCDLDGDGKITVLDARMLVAMCSCPKCVCP